MGMFPGGHVQQNPLDYLELSPLQQLALDACAAAKQGRVPTYIPRLASAPPTAFAVQVRSISGSRRTVGDGVLKFPLMSVIKPFVFLYLLEMYGLERVLAHVGVDASDQSFNSLEQLRQDNGFPRNPMINSGAIALSALLPGDNPAAACETFLNWLCQQSGANLVLDVDMLMSVQSLVNDRNRAIAQELYRTGHLERSVDGALEIYERVCCFSGAVADLAQLGVLLVQEDRRLQAVHRRMVQAVMLTCGLYEQSSRFTFQVGLPTKSGVSGCVLSLVPGRGAIACYSPPLDAMGSSIAGLYFIRHLAHRLNLSLFA